MKRREFITPLLATRWFRPLRATMGQPSDRTHLIAMLSEFAAGDPEPRLGLQLCSRAKFEL
jgi:hypothetical protein